MKAAESKINPLTCSSVLLIIGITILSGLFITTVAVNHELYDPLRTGKIIFFAHWIVIVIPIGLFVSLRTWKQSCNYLSLLILIWAGWMLLRGKHGGICYDEKFFCFSGCIIVFFLVETLQQIAKKNNQGWLLSIPAQMTSLLAVNIVPHKFYPLYLLANLYIETEQKEKAIVTARQLLNKEVKVPSLAIEKIQEKMQEVINSNTVSSNETNDKIKKGKNHTKIVQKPLNISFGNSLLSGTKIIYNELIIE